MAIAMHDALAAIRQSLPDYVQPHFDGAVKGIRWAAENLITALPAAARGPVVLALYRAKLSPKLFTPILSECWIQDAHGVQIAAKTEARLLSIWRWAGVHEVPPLPVRSPHPPHLNVGHD